MSIASEIARLQQAKADLKTAINAKGRAITDEPLDEYAAEVDAIVTGGGAPTTGDYLVRFIDYDGTILKEEWVNSGNNATPPTLPDHSADCPDGGLTFVEWNNDYTNITQDLDVGACYNTTDGKTHATVEITTKTGLALELTMRATDTGTISINWGDGNPTEDFAVTNSVLYVFTHTYPTIGVYRFSLDSNPTITYSLGSAGNNRAFLTSSVDTVSQGELLEIFCGVRVSSLMLSGETNLSRIAINPNIVLDTYETNYSRRFAQCSRVYAIVFPKTWLTFSDSTFDCTYGCHHIVVSKNTIHVGEFCFYFSNITHFNAFESITTIKESAFSYCRNLSTKIIKLDSLTTVVGASQFHYCVKIEEVDMSITPSSILPTFGYCFSLKSIILREGATSIQAAFVDNCVSLESIILPSTITQILNYAFRSTVALKSLTIPQGVVTLGAYSFTSMQSLAELTLPSSVVVLPANGLRDTYMTDIYILGNITSIAGTFKYTSTNFKSFKMRFPNVTSVPTLADLNLFLISNMHNSVKIFVPDSLVSAFKAATNWVKYSEYIYPISEDV